MKRPSTEYRVQYPQASFLLPLNQSAFKMGWQATASSSPAPHFTEWKFELCILCLTFVGKFLSSFPSFGLDSVQVDSLGNYNPNCRFRLNDTVVRTGYSEHRIFLSVFLPVPVVTSGRTVKPTDICYSREYGCQEGHLYVYTWIIWAARTPWRWFMFRQHVYLEARSWSSSMIIVGR